MKFELEEEESTGINITPMIDIVFQLILFLLIATSLSEEVSEEQKQEAEQLIELRLPESEAGNEQPREMPEVIVINIDENGGYVVHGRSLSRGSLRQLLGDVAIQDTRTRIAVRAHRQVAFQHVVDVVGDCYRLKLRNLDIRVIRGAGQQAAPGDDPLDVGRQDR